MNSSCNGYQDSLARVPAELMALLLIFVMLISHAEANSSETNDAEVRDGQEAPVSPIEIVQPGTSKGFARPENPHVLRILENGWVELDGTQFLIEEFESSIPRDGRPIHIKANIPQEILHIIATLHQLEIPTLLSGEKKQS